MDDHFRAELEACAADVEAGLEAWLTGLGEGGGRAPDLLLAAMRHGSLGGGKRLRPLLVRQAAGLFGMAPGASLAAGLAVEAVHCYSLIHDDLPAMDDDVLRRGRPTVHVAFGEAVAILAGDGLLTQAFGILADPRCHRDPDIRTRLVSELVAGAGVGGMVGGQLRDMEAERDIGLAEGAIMLTNAMKTGALIRAAVRMGAIIGGADAGALTALTTYATEAGVAFQLADDILDETATTEALGKVAGRDVAGGKQTIVSRVGVAEARRRLAGVVERAMEALDPFGPEADGLRATCRYFASRGN